jgi:hypothetical protein
MISNYTVAGTAHRKEKTSTTWLRAPVPAWCLKGALGFRLPRSSAASCSARRRRLRCPGTGIPIPGPFTPTGHTWQVVNAWGDHRRGAPEFKNDTSQSATDQALQAGMHHDGMHFEAAAGSNSPGFAGGEFGIHLRRPALGRHG